MNPTAPPPLPQPAGKRLTFSVARNCMWLNLLGAPGLGSLMGKRFVAGTLQLLLTVGGFALLIVWFCRLMMVYYGQISGESTLSSPPPGMAVAGGLAFAISWIWSFFTGLSLFREARARAEAELRSKAPVTLP